MPQYRIILECETDGIDTVYPCQDATFALRIVCAHCGYRQEKLLFIEFEEKETQSRNAHIPSDRHSWSCKDCARQGSICLHPIENATSTSRNIFPIATAEVRGSLSLTGWDPHHTTLNGRRVASQSETADVDNIHEAQFSITLTDGEWMDYDEINEGPVGITSATGCVSKL
ncbi:thioredoxin family protein [Perkinsela sp. CCAP 1560/4]|nr:thioredoxin family protein [Perkinsela sp. CCAP 1560/4]|eukprot:KNH06806.1 thioredoxin family protein [Perkinsela sp. CCAP 1560/4]